MNISIYLQLSGSLQFVKEFTDFGEDGVGGGLGDWAFNFEQLALFLVVGNDGCGGLSEKVEISS